MFKLVYKHADLSEASEIIFTHDTTFLIETEENFESLAFLMSMKDERAVHL